MRAETRTRRRRTVQTVIEYRCVYCGAWQEARRPALTCSSSCRTLMHRLLARGEWPRYAV